MMTNHLMKALTVVSLAMALALTAGAAQAQQGSGAAAPASGAAEQRATPANPGKGPLSSVGKSLPRQKNALQARRDSLLARARASSRRAQPEAATKTGQ